MVAMKGVPLARRALACAPAVLVIVGAGLLLSFGSEAARADLVDEERAAQWEQWREEPLDLGHATLEEIELLPASDARVAEALLTLRELDALPSDLETLGEQLGLGGDVAESWKDLVVIDDGDPSRGIVLRSDTRMGLLADPTGSAEIRGQFTARAGPLLLAHGARSQGGEPGRTWGAFEWGEFTLFAGHLRARTGDGLVLADVGVRSRTGPVRAPRLPRLQGRSGTVEAGAPTGVGVQWSRPATASWIAALRDPAGRESVVGAASAAYADLRLGLAWTADAERVRPSAWIARGQARGGAWWVAVGRARRGAVSHAGAHWSGATWSVGAAFTRAASPGEAGVDPLTGSSLDRTHRVWQIDAALRERTWTFEVLARRQTRGRPDALATRERSRVRWEWRPSVGPSEQARWRLALETGLDEDLTEPIGEGELGTSSQRLRVERERSGARTVVVWRRAGRVGARQEAIALRLGFDHRLVWSLAIAVAAGQRSSPWSVQQPGYGSTPLWVEPAGTAASLGARVGARGPFEAGAWFWWREGPQRGADHGFGLAVRLRTGGSGAIVAR